MARKYVDWADWAGDHHEQVEAERRASNYYGTLECPHAEILGGRCTDCTHEIEGWEPDDTDIPNIGKIPA